MAYNIPLFQPDAAKVAANGGGRLLTNFDDYATTFNGIELSLTKRMSNRWMARLAGAWNNPQEHYDMAVPVNENGNPTRSDTFPLIDGGQLAPRSAGSGSGDVFINQRWNFNVNGAYQLPWGMEARRQPVRQAGHAAIRTSATPRSAARARVRILLNEELDSDPVRQRCGTSTFARRRTSSSARRGSVQFIADLFNVMNSARRSRASAMRRPRRSGCSART